MSWFTKEKKENKDSELPKLPEPPKLPELPDLEENFSEKQNLPKLPSYPKNSFGEKFSKSAIKDAISGGKEGDKWGFEADESFNDEMMMQKPQQNKTLREIPFKQNFQNKRINPIIENRRREIDIEFPAQKKAIEVEPIFVRLDKFQESLEIFEEARRNIAEIESLLRDIKKKKNEEEMELQEWEREIQNIKNQLEKVDKNIFSKVR